MHRVVFQRSFSQTFCTLSKSNCTLILGRWSYSVLVELAFSNSYLLFFSLTQISLIGPRDSLYLSIVERIWNCFLLPQISVFGLKVPRYHLSQSDSCMWKKWYVNLVQVKNRFDVRPCVYSVIESLRYDDDDGKGNGDVCSPNAPLRMRFTSRWRFQGKSRTSVNEFCRSVKTRSLSFKGKRIAAKKMAME